MEPILLHNANFITFARTGDLKALLINNGLIEKIFRGRERLPTNIGRIDLNGNHVIPGFIDCHTHLVSMGIKMQMTDLSTCRSLKACLDKLRANLNQGTGVLFGVGWDESIWAGGKKESLNRFVLDRISRQRPIVMRRVCGHFAVCNTVALNQIPQVWRIIDRKNGLLYEDAALYLFEIFPQSDETLVRAIEISQDLALSLGITSVHEITNVRRFKIFQKLRNRLKLRISLYPISRHFDEIIKGGFGSNFGDDFLKLSGIKFFLDGSIGAMTAALTKPYDNSKNTGELLISKSGLKEIIKKAEVNSLQLMVHSIGDRATATLIEAFREFGLRKNVLRHRIEHLEIADERIISKIAQLGLIASMQPNFVYRWQLPGGMYEKNLGARYTEMNPFKRLLKAGVRVAFGSDTMPIGPLYGLKGAFIHPSPCGRLKPLEAIKIYTKEGAYPTFDENKKGEIMVGKFADLTVLDRNPVHENLDQCHVRLVLVAGKIVYPKKHSQYYLP